MAVEDYIRARKQGLKAYHANVQKHISPYLPVLEEIAGHINGLTHVSLGLIQIPLKNVVGTGTKGRTNAFASNFMPILDPNSEFCSKWAHLYDSVVQDGLRQPVRCLEYLNRFYVLEGNKRVSVMKYLDAVSIEAEVTRVIPRRTNTLENRLYFEFLNFYKDTAINNIWFSQEGSFARLCELTGHTVGEPWSSEDKMDLQAAYMRFRREYKALFGDRLGITTGDAFLIYLTVYGYEGTPQKLSSQIMDDLKRLREEFERSNGEETVALIMDPLEQKTRSLRQALFGPGTVKVGFLYHREPRISGWNYWHDLGRINAENALGEHMVSTVAVCQEPEEFEGALEQLIRDGNRLIFTTSPLILDTCIKPSLEHPDVKILNCSLLASYYHVRSYYLRLYEAKFLIGMVAGAMSQSGKIGYIADYPIYGAPASINAFAAGARMVNPRAKIFLEWSTRKDFDPEDPFHDPEISVISNRDINAPKYSSKEYGLYAIEADGQLRNLAIPVLDWSKFYSSMALSVLNGSFDADQSGKCALDYWWGMSSDALDIVLSTKTDPYLRRLINITQAQLQSGQLWPFEGELRDQKGNLRCQAEAQLPPAEIIAMDYLADNVFGCIPDTAELKDSARPMVMTQGLREVAKPEASTFNWTNIRQG